MAGSARYACGLRSKARARLFKDGWRGYPYRAAPEGGFIAGQRSTKLAQVAAISLKRYVALPGASWAMAEWASSVMHSAFSDCPSSLN